MSQVIFPETVIEDAGKVAGVEHARDLYNAANPSQKPLTASEYLQFIAISAVASYADAKARHDRLVIIGEAEPVQSVEDRLSEYEAAQKEA
jgi:hypothetical protein